jgi:hypothetical protein
MRKQRIDTRSFMRLADIFVQSAAKLRFRKAARAKTQAFETRRKNHARCAAKKN